MALRTTVRWRERAHYLGHLDAFKPALSVWENIEFWVHYLGGDRDAAPALAAVRLKSLQALPAAYLSAGQRRRLSLARLVAVPRPLWLLDEPASALDSAGHEMLAGTDARAFGRWRDDRCGDPWAARG